jgi:hypothetical protein
MEYLVIVMTLLVAVSYAVFVGVSIERGKSWAREVARAVSMLDPYTVDYHLREQLRDPGPGDRPDPEPEEQPRPDRLAA